MHTKNNKCINSLTDFYFLHDHLLIANLKCKLILYKVCQCEFAATHGNTNLVCCHWWNIVTAKH